MEPHGIRVKVRHSGNPPLLNCMMWGIPTYRTKLRANRWQNKESIAEVNSCHGSPTFYDKGPYRFLRAGTRTKREKITIYGIPNCLNYCEISIVYTSFGGPGSSVGIVTDYELDGPGSNPGGGTRFSARPDRPWSPPSLL